MKSADRNEKKRLSDLAATGIMDSLPETAYDDITTLASYICDTPIAYISFLDDKRQWYKSSKNIPFSETSLDDALCSYTLRETALVHVPDLTADERFQDNTFVMSDIGIRFYAGYPLINSEGSALGTICVLDFKVRELSDEQKFALEALGRQVVAQLELRRFLNHSQNAALHDDLTTLPRRLLLNERLAQACQHASTNSTSCAALFIDLDNFKAINDTYGHAAGDETLITVASRLKTALRKEDTVGRVGGDEFIAVLYGIADEAAVISIIKSLQDTLSLPISFEGTDLNIAASIGVALYPNHSEYGDDLIKKADIALYEAKRAGKGTFRIFRDIYA